MHLNRGLWWYWIVLVLMAWIVIGTLVQLIGELFHLMS
jgi:hypothetical protein